jgi:Sulfotransferase family
MTATQVNGLMQADKPSSFPQTVPALADEKIKVVFIAGCGRSGTTLLAQLLGEFDNFVNVGEAALYLFKPPKTLPCGCGSAAVDCLFWKDILQAIPKGLSDQGAKSLRVQNFPALFREAKQHHIPTELKPILAALGDTYRTIVRESGCKIIVDSSKHPSTGLLASMIPGVELHVVHVVRSPHSVVASWTRKNGYLAVHPPGKVVSWWWTHNLLAEALKFRAKSYQRVRYEDFARNPGPVLEQITTDVVGQPLPMDFLQGTEATVHMQHVLAGNPSKFNTGKIKIRDANSSAAGSRKLLTNLLTFPLQYRYRYLLPPQDNS